MSHYRAPMEQNWPELLHWQECNGNSRVKLNAFTALHGNSQLRFCFEPLVKLSDRRDHPAEEIYPSWLCFGSLEYSKRGVECGQGA